MIDEKKLILHLNDWMLQESIMRHMKNPADTIAECIKAIEEQPKIDRWIPAEKTPKNGDYVLLSFANFSIPLVGRYEEDEGGGAYYVGDDDESCASKDVIVNAWQPLPEPYMG